MWKFNQWQEKQNQIELDVLKSNWAIALKKKKKKKNRYCCIGPGMGVKK